MTPGHEKARSWSSRPLGFCRCHPLEVDEVVEGDKNEQIASLKPTASGFCGPAEPQACLPSSMSRPRIEIMQILIDLRQ
jgi:hypothetical protein